MKRSPRGWVLLDALLAWLLLGSALLGLFLSTAQALQQQRDQAAWAQALHLSDDLLARMAINREGVSAYLLAAGETPSPVDCTHTACSASQWAQADLASWQRRVQSELPQGDAQVLRSATDDGQRLIWLEWSALASAVGVATPTDPTTPVCPDTKRCYALWVLP